MAAKRSSVMMWTAWLIIVAVIVLDQVVKVWVKTHMYLGEDISILPWFHICFVQNNGMAFGLEILNKFILTFLRIGLFGFLCWYIARLSRNAWVPMTYLASIALIAAGAFGNIIDCVFYGEIFNNPMPPAVASFVPFGQGYGELFHGLVVDMLYFPLFSFTWPDWIPWIGGRVFEFFNPVFNIADAAISVGLLIIVIFYYRLMEHSLEDEKPEKNSNN